MGQQLTKKLTPEQLGQAVIGLGIYDIKQLLAGKAPKTPLELDFWRLNRAERKLQLIGERKAVLVSKEWLN